MASIPRAQQVLKEQIVLRAERYPGYYKDLMELLNDNLRAIADSTDRSKRRRDLLEGIKAKASQIPSSGAAT